MEKVDELRICVRNEVRKLISENTKLITEKWSICDKVQDGVENVLNTIYQTVFDGDCDCIIERQLYLYQGTIKNFNLFDDLITINYFVYNCSNKEYCDYIYEQGYELNGYIESEKILNITLYMINSKWNENICENNVVHELEHILQIKYGKMNNKNYSSLMKGCYNLANSILQDKSKHSQYEVCLALLFYYCNSHEQDAFIQEYARDLKKNPKEMLMQTNEIHKILNLVENNYKFFIDNENNFSNAIKAYRIFGYNTNSMKVMFSKQIDRFKKKIKNVEKNFQNTLIN